MCVACKLRIVYLICVFNLFCILLSEEIKRETGSNSVSLKQLDLCSLASIRKFAKEINEEENRLDILVNNAGAQGREKIMTADEMESNFQANHFGPFLLTNLLLGNNNKALSIIILKFSRIQDTILYILNSLNYM